MMSCAALLVAAPVTAEVTAIDDLASLPARCSRMFLPVATVAPPPMAFSEFCQSNPGHCGMRGPRVLRWRKSLARDLAGVNRAVNAEVRFVPDHESSGEEELWSYPKSGAGDCEDLALEKRRRLVALGLPRAALTMAIIHHRTLGFSHAVLVVEKTRGSFVLDNLTDEIKCWSRLPFNFETRERPDGLWTRFDQQDWYASGPRMRPVRAPSAAR